LGSRSCDGSISLIIASPQHVINRAAAAGAFAAEGKGDERHCQPMTFDHTCRFYMARSLLLVDGEEAGVTGNALPLGRAEQVSVAIWHWLGVGVLLCCSK
jgi:hypothetical protein